ncbi:MAG: hypothetical protein RPR40_13170, partial [Bermanella sp.]
MDAWRDKDYDNILGINPGGGRKAATAFIEYLGTAQKIPVVYGDSELPIIWLGFRQYEVDEFVALATFCYGSIEEVEYITINGQKFLPGEGEYPGDNYNEYGVSYTISKYGEGVGGETMFDEYRSAFPKNPNLGTDSPTFLRGLAGIFFHFDISKDFITGIPSVSVKIKGKSHVFDPRIESEPNTASEVYPWAGITPEACTNPALIYADYLTNTWYGKGLSWDRIDLPQLAAAADVCDTAVLDGDGNTIPLMAFNGSLDTSEKIDSN